MNEITKTNNDKKDLYFVEHNFLKNFYFSMNPYCKNIFEKKYQVRTLEKTKYINGKKIKTLWQVSANAVYGYPTSFDYQVFDSLMTFIYKKYGFPIPEQISFKFNDILKNLKENKSGFIYRRIKNSLQRLKATNINSIKSYYNKTLEKWDDVSFSIINEIHFKGEVSENNEVIESNYLILNKYFRDNLNHNFYYFFNSAIREKLTSPLTKRTYEILSIYFYGINKGRNYINPVMDFEYGKVVNEWYLMTENKFISKAKEQLASYYDELVKTNILEKYEFYKDNNNTIKIKFHIGKLLVDSINKKSDDQKRHKEIKKWSDISDIRISNLIKKYSYEDTLKMAKRKLNLNLQESLEELLNSKKDSENRRGK